MTIHDPPEWTVYPACIAALVCSPCWPPVREVEVRHGGAVVIRTVARRENPPDVKAVDRQTIQVSLKFLERLNAEIQEDKYIIHMLSKSLDQVLNTNKTATQAVLDIEFAKQLLLRFKQTS